MDKISALIKETPKELSRLSCQCEDREEMAAMKQEAGSPETLCLLAPCLCAGSENQETSISAVLKLSVCGDVLQQPEQTRTLEVLYLFPPNF